MLTGNLSGQYTDDTAAALADVLLEGATAETRIAVISAPSVYVHLIKKLVSMLILNPFQRPHICCR